MKDPFFEFVSKRLEREDVSDGLYDAFYSMNQLIEEVNKLVTDDDNPMRRGLNESYAILSNMRDSLYFNMMQISSLIIYGLYKNHCEESNEGNGNKKEAK